MAEEGRSVEPYLLSAVLDELARRFGFDQRQAPPPPCPLCGQLRDGLAGWYRWAARRCHPDVGGSDEAMKLVNGVRDDLAELLGAGAGA